MKPSLLIVDVMFCGLLLGRKGDIVKILEVSGGNLIIQNPKNGRKGIVKSTLVR